MEMTTLDNVAIGMMLILAFLGIIVVVYHCAKLERRIDKLETKIIKIEGSNEIMQKAIDSLSIPHSHATPIEGSDQWQ